MSVTIRRSWTGWTPWWCRPPSDRTTSSWWLPGNAGCACGTGRALAALMVGRTGIAVAGTMARPPLAWWPRCCKLPAQTPAVIGAPLGLGTHAHLGSGTASLSSRRVDGSFLQYPARIVVITNVEADHLDNWGDSRHYAAGFNVSPDRWWKPSSSTTAQAPTSWRGCGRRQSARILTYGESAGSDIRLVGLATGASPPLRPW